MNKSKLLKKVLNNPKNIKFSELKELVIAFGFYLSRIRGSHHIFTHKKIKELVNIQNDNGMAKAYQVMQFLNLVEKNNLKLEDDKK
ncbi:MAG: type II toxin-antitoxin system HicA family toxin [Candidatus Eremiobacterota bacterium]